MPSTPKKVDVSKAIPGLESLPLEKVEYKRPEDEQEKCSGSTRNGSGSTSKM